MSPHSLLCRDVSITTLSPTHRGIVLKDLVAIDIQSKDMLNPAQSILNMNKYRNLWKVLAGIRASQTMSPLLTPDLDRMRVLRVGAKDG